MSTLLLLLTACGGETTPTETMSDACAWEEERGTCPSCSDGEVTCTLDGVEVTSGTCGSCQVLWKLASELCAAGSDVTTEEIEGADCTDPTWSTSD
ncbi:MAG: hypothetical protein H6735_00710 [Alphaproteobacteria bacterium]|nr:hypothetical protein [Alphaproteobacteria bacterium]